MEKRKHICVGILAHVDAGKTTLSEAILYTAGNLRKFGRVDNGDAFLDTYELERSRGITIFSKQAEVSMEEMDLTLLDTPGHVDFSAEMERTLQVLDYAILVISGADGVQGHTLTLWSLLKRYEIPTFLFINKMDQNGTDKTALLEELQERLSSGCIDFGTKNSDEFYEAVAMEDEELLDQYLESGEIEDEQIRKMITERKIFPCFFGSALKLQGVEEFLNDFGYCTEEKEYPEQFGARVFKITRDESGNRLTHLKVTGKDLKVKTVITSSDEKINQIRIYSGEKYETVNELEAGRICAVTGLSDTYPGQCLGVEQGGYEPVLEPVLTYQMILPEQTSATIMLPKLRQLEEEEPELHIIWNEELQEIQVQIMGEVQIEILKSLIKERFDVDVEFGQGNIVYKETIANTVEGVGHFEPLRHYAEVHLLLEPLERGSGVVIDTQCSEDILDKNWQRLILTHLLEKEHRGVLTGAPITDIKITLAAGRAHQKHTEGGDFRQATYRAVRQGLRMAESILLEPYYKFRLEIPQQMVGRAMTDIEKMHGTFETPDTSKEMAVLQGVAPVSTMQGYQKEVLAYSKGMGRLFTTLNGYDICHNAEEIIEEAGYDPDHDLENPCGSVFCSHGAGYNVSWDEVPEHMHLESVLAKETEEEEFDEIAQRRAYIEDEWIDTDEIDKILEQTFYANQHNKSKWKKKKAARIEQDYHSSAEKSSVKRDMSKKYLLVDGYNVIYAWDELKELLDTNVDAARGKLLDEMCNYQGMKGMELIVVFDAYRVKGHETEITDYLNIHVVYTKEAETADQYIEKFAHTHGRKYDVTVATSDGLEQIIIRGQGCRLLSARELKRDYEEAKAQIRTEYLDKQKHEKSYVTDGISLEDTMNEN
ncbi:translation factor GTPase family protein [Anaerostipes sp. Marseille-Q3525]|uniref:translation factor GTPase family protein n=1 Tax=Anaerostipes sp. Marseille-Q3525 TaxID=2758418 RepID=UPI001BAA9EA2|nr:TetM/TetW/TetO/TetS family tetracycline resistance ribosomal protection protein [Anaerostipes sp. Marseille-Q3525]MBR9962091.1 TetM/TetW/TetO/TetS family tetracycline resistance ribosomal protection protein [Anaerostipes sp. Marseille-Q3525]